MSAMTILWVVVAAITCAAAHAAWERRHLWHTRHAGPVKAALAFGVGLSLCGPYGEPVGFFSYALIPIHNTEDIAGHLLVLAAATLTARRALRTLGWRDDYLIRSAWACAAAILLAAYSTGTMFEPSSAGAPADTGYWPITSLILAPAFALAALAHTIVAYEHPKHRVVAVLHAVPATVGLAGCVLRLIPAVPVPVTYWLFAVSLAGLVIASRVVWYRMWVKPRLILRAL